MAITVQAGCWQGNAIRKARKACTCDYRRGEAGRCGAVISVGALYVEGELAAWSANPFTREKYCLACARVNADGSQVTEE